MKNKLLSHIHYERAMTALLDVKQILIRNEEFVLADKLGKFTDEFIKQTA